MLFLFVALVMNAVQVPFSFAQGALANEQIALRWMHFFFGIVWIGLLYFFNLVGTPTMKGLDAPVRAKVFPALMSRAMWWFRWSALITVVSGLRYFWMLLAADARNAGNPALAWQWIGMVAAGMARGVRADLSVSDAAHGNSRQRMGARNRNFGDCHRRVAGGAAAECECGIVERASGDQRGRRNGIADAAQRVGNYLARAETADCVDARERRAGHADAARSRAAGAVGVSRITHGILDVAADAFLHGGCGALPVLERDYQLERYLYSDSRAAHPMH